MCAFINEMKEKESQTENSNNLLSLTKITIISWFAAEAIILSFNSTEAKTRNTKELGEEKIAVSKQAHRRTWNELFAIIEIYF